MSGFLVLVILVLECIIIKEILSQAPSPYRSYQWTPPIYEPQNPTYTYQSAQNPSITYPNPQPSAFPAPIGVAPLESHNPYLVSNQYPVYSKQNTPPAQPANQETPFIPASYAPLPYPKPPTSQTIPISNNVQSKPSYPILNSYSYPKPSNPIPLPENSSPMSAPVITTTPRPAAESRKTSEGVDSTVLNNLAIALQLLIVSNLLKSSIETTESPFVPPIEEPVSFSIERFTPTSDYSKPNYISNVYDGLISEKPLSNANFLGSSNVLSPISSMSSYTPPSSSRSSYSLMSPYEALSPDPVPSYGSVGSFSRDFQSPYDFSNYGNDAFSFGDIF